MHLATAFATHNYQLHWQQNDAPENCYRVTYGPSRR